MNYTKFDTRLCEIILAGNDEGLTHLHLNTGKGKRRFEISDAWKNDDAFFGDARNQIQEYFNKKRKWFDVPINPKGTDFQKRVWGELSRIPYGELKSYKEIAWALGNENASRAVGMANSRNPIPLIIPCHRVIGTNGSLTGFAHGLEIKKWLIQFEQAGSL
jgi:methylated-DNA-[protein]-cysteine S-methyltransferase